MSVLNNFTIFSVFKKNNMLYIIFSINNYVLKQEDLIVNIDNKPLQFNSKIVKDNNEPILILMYDINFKHSNNFVNIIYNVDITNTNITNTNIIFNTILENKNYIIPFDTVEYTTTNNDLVITTLFKDDYNLFNLFYTYYKKQGVSHFYMYYNGLINEDITNIFNKPDITLIEWNFRYWNKGCKYDHHAQSGQLHDALYKYGKYRHKYMIFCDLDEYLYVPNKTLKLFINEKNADYYQFHNRWSKTVDNKIPKNIPFEFIHSPHKSIQNSRTKCIYKTNNIITLNIHYASKFIKKNIETVYDLNMYHFYKWSSKQRDFNTNGWLLKVFNF